MAVTSKSTLNSDNFGTVITAGRSLLLEIAANDTSYVDSLATAAVETDVGNIIPFSGILRNLWIDVYYNDLDAGSSVFTLLKNGSDTAITVTVSFGVTSITSDTANTESITAGDRISLKVVNTGSTGFILFSFSYQIK